MLYTAATALLLGSTRKLRFSSSFPFCDSLLRNLSTATERLGFLNPNIENPTTESNHSGYTNGFNGGDESLGGFQPNSSGRRYGFVSEQNQNQSNDLYNQSHRNWLSSDVYYSSYNNGSLQGNGGLVQRQASLFAANQSWDCYNGGQSQTWNPHVHSHNQGENHFQQDGSSGQGSSLDELDSICREGKVKEAVGLIQSWRNKGYIVDLARLLSLARLCGDAKALREAKIVHEFINSLVSLSDIGVYISVIEMYSGCGSVDDALTVFNCMPEKNLRSWCAIIRCFAENGQGEDAIDMFSRFKEEGNRPDGEIFKEVFFTCGVLGDIDEGLLHFESMIKDYGIVPSLEHYVCLVKMVAEPGHLDQALELVESMEPNVDLWETLMNLSWVHGDLELGDRCRDMVEELDGSRLNKETKSGLVPIKSSDVAKEKLQRMARGRTFGSDVPAAAGDIFRPENREFYIALKCLKEHMVEIGYVPESKLALHDVDQESKDENLLLHSEKFAFIKQMLNSPARSLIMVMKNLRICIDCHNALKLMSKIVGRELKTRDAKRFHHMKEGVCSCNDYW